MRCSATALYGSLITNIIPFFQNVDRCTNPEYAANDGDCVIGYLSFGLIFMLLLLPFLIRLYALHDAKEESRYAKQKSRGVAYFFYFGLRKYALV